MGLGVHIGVHPQGYAGRAVEAGGHVVQPLQLRLGFHVEAKDVRLQRPDHFLGRLAHPGKHDLAGIAAGPEHALQFTAGDDIETGTQPGQQAQYGEIGVGLDRVADQMILAGEGQIEGTPGALDGRPGIDIAGRAVGGRHLREVHTLDEKPAFAIVVDVHKTVGP